MHPEDVRTQEHGFPFCFQSALQTSFGGQSCSLPYHSLTGNTYQNRLAEAFQFRKGCHQFPILAHILREPETRVKDPVFHTRTLGPESEILEKSLDVCHHAVRVMTVATGRAEKVHGYVGKTQLRGCPKHLLIFCSGAYIIDYQAARRYSQFGSPANEKRMRAAYYSAPPGVNGNRDSGKLLRSEAKGRLETLPLLLHAHRLRSRPCAACAEIDDISTFREHRTQLPLKKTPVRIPICIKRSAAAVERIIRQIDDSHNHNFAHRIIHVGKYTPNLTCISQKLITLCEFVPLDTKNIFLMLIVLEGLDGAGKSTQVKKLRNYLTSVCDRLDYIHFPRYDAPVYGELISRFLRGDFGSNEAVHPQLVALLFAEDRHGAAPAMRKVLEEGGDVLLDRYVYSNIAYQCAKIDDASEAERLRDWIFNTEYGDFNLPKPDLNIFLDVPIGFVESRLKSARQGTDREYLAGAGDIHEADINFQKKVRDIYRKQCQADPSLVRIDCSDEYGDMLPPDDIFARIKACVDEKLGR